MPRQAFSCSRAGMLFAPGRKRLQASVSWLVPRSAVCAMQETRAGTCFLAPVSDHCLRYAGNAYRQAFPGGRTAALLARRSRHVQTRTFQRPVRQCITELHLERARKRFRNIVFKGIAAIQGNACLHVFCGGLLSRASQKCIWRLPASVFAKLFPTASRESK